MMNLYILEVMLRFYVIFHKKLYESAYEKVNKDYIDKYVRFCAVNRMIPKEIPASLAANVFHEHQLQNYNPFMQFNKFCESSVFFHVYKNPSLLLDPFRFVGFFHYDMVLQNSTFAEIEYALQVLEQPDKTLFVFKADHCFPHLHQIIYLQGWELIVNLYNGKHGTSHKMEEIIKHQIPLYHTFLVPRDIFRKMMEFAELCAPILFDLMGQELKHYPYHLERLHGLFLLLQTLDGHIIRWIQMSGVDHRSDLNDPWQKVEEEKYLAKRNA